jgi:hypothetical protein
MQHWMKCSEREGIEGMEGVWDRTVAMNSFSDLDVFLLIFDLLK